MSRLSRRINILRDINVDRLLTSERRKTEAIMARGILERIERSFGDVFTRTEELASLLQQARDLVQTPGEVADECDLMSLRLTERAASERRMSRRDRVFNFGPEAASW